MWSLLEEVSEGNWKKKEHFALFSALFKATGAVRESQVNLLILERYNVSYLSTYAEHLSELQKKAEKLFYKEMNKFSFDRLEELNNTLFQEVKTQSNTMTMEQLLSFILVKTRKVYRLRKKLPNNRILHKIRINLKAVSEILTITNDLNTNAVLDDFLNSIKWFNEQIGDWHDFEILLKSIKNFIKSNRQKKHLAELKRFSARTVEWQDEKQVEIKMMLSRHLSREQQEQLKSCI